LLTGLCTANSIRDETLAAVAAVIDVAFLLQLLDTVYGRFRERPDAFLGMQQLQFETAVRTRVLVLGDKPARLARSILMAGPVLDK
jgi:hypothetical protein